MLGDYFSATGLFIGASSVIYSFSGVSLYGHIVIMSTFINKTFDLITIFVSRMIMMNVSHVP